MKQNHMWGIITGNVVLPQSTITSWTTRILESKNSDRDGISIEVDHLKQSRVKTTTANEDNASGTVIWNCALYLLLTIHGSRKK